LVKYWPPPFMLCAKVVVEHGYRKLPFSVWLLNQLAMPFWCVHLPILCRTFLISPKSLSQGRKEHPLTLEYWKLLVDLPLADGFTKNLTTVLVSVLARTAVRMQQYPVPWEFQICV
jgi:hypothetical protein